MQNRRYQLKVFLSICVFWCLLFGNAVNGHTFEENANVIHAVSLIGNVLEGCYLSASATPFVHFLPSLQSCLQNGSLLVLDQMQQSKVLQLSDGIQFVDNKMGFTATSNDTSTAMANEKDFNWRRKMLLKLNKLFHSHILKIRLNAAYKLSQSKSGEARRRHHSQMMPLIIFATVALGMVLIPMGFKFLAVLGGKALLLSKLALILSSIQGLKKVASSNLSYGLYQTNDRC